MLEITGAELHALPITDLEWVQDLDYFDGPLLSVFKHRKHGDKYLYRWCDCDHDVNRWMVLRVSETNIIRLANRIIPLDQVVPLGCQDDFVYFVDVDKNGSARKIILSAIESIPQKYIPLQGAFLSLDVVEQQAGTYSILIERDLTIENLRDLFRHFSCAYAFLYNVIALGSQRFRSHPFLGGWSYNHFWNELLSSIPIEDTPKLGTLQYQSPGFIRYNLDSDIASRVGNLVVTYQARESIKSNYRDLDAYIRANHLNDDITLTDQQWATHNPQLTEFATNLLSSLQLGSPADFIEAAKRPFEAAKMALAFVRRIRELAKLEEDRRIRFPNLVEFNPPTSQSIPIVNLSEQISSGDPN